jgi:hypothetical protein
MAMAWLNYEAKHRGIHIQHALNGGEKRFFRPDGWYYDVDGWCAATGQAFDFHGSYWHAHPLYLPNRTALHPSRKLKGYTNEQVFERSNRRDAYLATQCKEHIVMWEHDWLSMQKKQNHGTTPFMPVDDTPAFDWHYHVHFGYLDNPKPNDDMFSRSNIVVS